MSHPELRIRRNLHTERSQKIGVSLPGRELICRYHQDMTQSAGKVHVVRVSKTGYVDKEGRRRDYSSAYLRRTYRDGGKVKNETVANLSSLPNHVIDLIDAGLKGRQLVPAGEAVTITGSLPHGHVAAVHALARELGLPALLASGPAAGHGPGPGHLQGRGPGLEAVHPDLVGRYHPGRRPGRGRGQHRRHLRRDGLAGASPGRHRGRAGPPSPGPGGQPGPDGAVRPVQLLDGGPVLPAGRPRLLPGRQKGRLQIEYGLLTDPAGRPVAVRVFPGNTGDPAAFTQITEVVRDKFGLRDMVMVGDRGMITSARIRALNQREDGTARPDAYGWITALRAPAIKKLMDEDGPLQLSLFDEQDLAEITSPDFPGERLIACRNPVLAADRARTRDELLAATEKLLAPVIARVRPRPAHRRRADRRRGRQGHQHVQDQQALPRRHHR